jgi:drug/metabolite transporter (DMT)-like permease
MSSFRKVRKVIPGEREAGAIFSLPWLHERPHRRLWCGIVGAVAGSVIIAGMDRKQRLT